MVKFVDDNYPNFSQSLRERGVRYHRSLPDVTDVNSALGISHLLLNLDDVFLFSLSFSCNTGKSWKETFNVETQEQAEVEVATMSEGWEFRDGLLHTTSHVLPGIITDPRNGREVFFNQVSFDILQIL